MNSAALPPLARWGLTATAILIVGFLGGRCSAYTGPLGRQAQLRVDSARIDQKAKHEADSASAVAFAKERRHLLNRLDSSEARLVTARQATDAARTGTHAGIGLVRQLIPVADTAALAALQALEDSLARYDSTVARERASAAQALLDAKAVLHADTVELDRRSGRIAGLERDVASGLDREEGLAKKLRGGWTLGLTIGPGASYAAGAAVPVRFSPVQVTVGATHEIRVHLPRLLPRL